MNVKILIGNYISIFLLLVITVDGLVANWTLNPIWDLFYARVQLNLFYNVHAVSILAVAISGYWLIYKKDSVSIAVFAVLGTAGIHEIMLDVVDLGIFQTSSGLSVTYLLYLLAFLLIGFKISKRYHKNVWLFTLTLMFVWYVVLSILPHGSTISATIPFSPSKDFYTPLANVEEVVSWLVPCSLWFMPRKYFQ